MDIGNREFLANGLEISVDWLSWTILEESYTVEDVLKMIGFSIAEFQKMPRGASGYMSRFSHVTLPISVLSDGREGMGIHVEVSGTAMKSLMNRYISCKTELTPFGDKAYSTTSFDYTVLSDFMRDIRQYGHVTRIDIAIDDRGCNYYSLLELSGILSEKRYTSKFRKWREIVEHDNSYDRSATTGYTIYLGSRESAIMLRIYDKQMERNKQLIQGGQEPIMYPWVRWELELKDERAEEISRILSTENTLNQVAIGVLSNYLRLVDLDNARIDRCSTSDKWQSFIDGIQALSLFVSSEPKTLDDTRRWLERQVSTSLAAVMIADCGDTAFLHKLIKTGELKLSQHQLDMINDSKSYCSVYEC